MIITISPEAISQTLTHVILYTCLNSGRTRYMDVNRRVLYRRLPWTQQIHLYHNWSWQIHTNTPILCGTILDRYQYACNIDYLLKLNILTKNINIITGWRIYAFVRLCIYSATTKRCVLQTAPWRVKIDEIHIRMYTFYSVPVHLLIYLT